MKECNYGNLNMNRADEERAPFSVQLKLLLFRTKIFVRREPQAIIAKMGQAVFVGLLILSLYFGVVPDQSATGV